MRRWSVFLSLFIALQLLGQPKASIEHYSAQEGLPQRHIMDIIQDRKGFIWLATWDGICKFDGYRFTSYKASSADSIFMSNNRIDRIVEDTFGYLWLHTYDHEIYTFDPKIKKFAARFQIADKPFKTSAIESKPSGKVWLRSETMGVLCATGPSGIVEVFSKENKNLPHNTVHAVLEDRDSISWILTADGLTKVSFAADTVGNVENFYAPSGKSATKTPFFSALKMDSEIWFGSDKGRIFRYNEVDKRFVPHDFGINSNIIDIQKVYDNLFVILTSNDGLIICDKSRAIIKSVNQSTHKTLPTNELRSCFVDTNRYIWLETNLKGIAKYKVIEDELKFYRPNEYSNNTNDLPNFFILEDKLGDIWTHPHGGFSYYDVQGDKLMPFHNNPRANNWKFSDILHSMKMDRQGNIWLSTRSGGLEKIVFDNTSFKLNDFYSNGIPVTGAEVRSFLEDTSGNIWLSNMNRMISVYDSKRNFKGFLNQDGSVSKTGKPLDVATAYTFVQDRTGQIWIGTKGDGIYLLMPQKGAKDTYQMKHYAHEATDPYSLSNNAVYSIHEDASAHIWIGTYGGGLNLFDRANQRFINIHNTLQSFPEDAGLQIRSINSRHNQVYLGTTRGLIVMEMDFNKQRIKKYRKYVKGKGIPANDIYDITITHNDDVYIATFGGGMSKVDSWDAQGLPTQFKTYNTDNGLTSDIILSILEDQQGHLWLNSEGSLSRFHPDTETFEPFHDVTRAIQNQNFTEAHPILTQDGEIIYGCTDGMLSFLPSELSSHIFVPYLALTKFNVSNRGHRLDVLVDDIPEIILNHTENTFSIEYAALDYASPNGISYAYMLEGFDKNWIYSHGQRMANYTKIPPGKYTFKVKSTNSNGTWTENVRSLPLVITPSFWQTNWAYVLYIFSTVLLLYLILRSIIIFYRMRDKVRLERAQTEMKTSFFTDISHEIRTPLTMIVSPIENILQGQQTQVEIKHHLQYVLNNANRMLKMVNQILDFRKVQDQKLRISEVPIGKYIEDLCDTSFNISATEGLQLHVDNQIGETQIWADPESMEKLAYNLISNAIKFSGKEKHIDIRIFRKDDGIALQIRDRGQGMDKDTLNKVFTRFASYNKDKSKPSTGIGLSIVKEIVDKHHARISVESALAKGTTFTVLFQLGLDHFSKDENMEISRRHKATASKDGSHQVLALDNRSQETSILVVEDDSDLRSFIVSVLQVHYLVYSAENGKEGYESVLQHMPDFIISDSMMPVMDGITFLSQVKANNNTSHIPFILLTAKTSNQDELEGIHKGADDYITKPFSVPLLVAKIDNILQQRKRYTSYLTDVAAAREQGTKKEKTKSITEEDAQFLENLRERVLQHIDDNRFTIEDLVGYTLLSRRVFFNKVKSLTGLAPIEFVREIRLKYAAELLKTKQYRIKEVVYMVGFSDIKYFSLCFKEKYGMTPGQYKSQ